MMSDKVIKEFVAMMEEYKEDASDYESGDGEFTRGWSNSVNSLDERDEYQALKALVEEGENGIYKR